MRAKPEMKPWGHTNKSKMSSDEERHYNASICLAPRSAAPLGFIDILNYNKPRACALGYAGVSP